MDNKNLIKTNLLVSVILIIGFILTAVLGYRANYQSSLDNIEQVSSLTAEDIYYQFTSLFSKPVNISLAMSQDSLLKRHLLEETEHLDDPQYVEIVKTYLHTYKERYGFDSVFLASTATRRYYNFNGLDRVLVEGDPENIWYDEFLKSGDEYSLNVDNDEVSGAENAITVFVNCRIAGADGSTIGVVGVGLEIADLKSLLQQYEDVYDVEISLIDHEGTVEISTTYNGYEKEDWFVHHRCESAREELLSWKDPQKVLALWINTESGQQEQNYVVTHYIPELDWHLVVHQNTSIMLQELQTQFMTTCVILLLVVVSILLIITVMIRNLNRQITLLAAERQKMFRKATEQLYDNIHEINISENRPANKQTEEYFKEVGAEGLPYDRFLAVFAEKQVKEEYREGYLAALSPAYVTEQFEKDDNHIQYDFMMTQDGVSYHWMRIDAYMFYMKEDASIHMFTYQKNIDDEKLQELKAVTDEMTGFYNKKTSEKMIQDFIDEEPSREYAVMIVDIDDFKHINDHYGHAFGDFCICRFTEKLREAVPDAALLGRIGGDEFIVLHAVDGPEKAVKLAKTILSAVNRSYSDGEHSCKISSSIGVATAPCQGNDFETLYKHADAALYHAKRNGKGKVEVEQ